MAAQSSSAIARNSSETTASQAASGHIATAFKRILRTTVEVIEAGKQLLILKKKTPHGKWSETVKALSCSVHVAHLMMRAATAFSGLDHVIHAAQSQGKLFELMALSHSELVALNSGATVRGVSAETLPAMTVKALRTALRNREAAKPSPAVQPPEVAPILGEALNDTGSKLASAPDSNLSPAMPLDAPETYPAVYTLLPGNFNGVPVSLVRHEGKVWMIAEEVAAILGESPEAVAEMEELISSAFDQNYPEGCYTKALLASTSLVMHLLDQRAVRYVCLALETQAALDLSEWIGADHLPCGEPAAPMPISNVKPGLTIKQSIQQLEGTNLDIFTMLSKVRSQLKSIGLVLLDYKLIAADPLIPNLIEIAENLIASFEDMTDSQEDAIMMLEKSIYRDPEAGAALP